MSSTSGGIYAFDCVIYTLAAIYVVVGALSFFQYCRLLIRENEDHVDKLAFCNFFWPSTVQQQVHLVIFLFSIVRTAFFFVALDSWDPTTGEVTADKVAFYSLDSFASVLFFTLASALALFWAELYYISKNEEDEFNYVIKPLTYTVNILAFIGVAVCSYIVSTDYENDIDYVFLQYTILSATVYFIAALMFGYYAHAAATEIKQVPIHLSARKSRLRLLRILALIIIIALIAKASILIAVTGENLPTISAEALSLLFLYYFFLELFPTAVVLVFYRVESRGEDGDDSDNRSVTSSDIHEREPLTKSGHHHISTEGSNKGKGSNTNLSNIGGNNDTHEESTSNSGKKGTSNIKGITRTSFRANLPKFGRSSTPDIVDAIIARLSSTDSRERGGSGELGRRSDGEFGSISSPTSTHSAHSFSQALQQPVAKRNNPFPPPGPLDFKSVDGEDKSLQHHVVGDRGEEAINKHDSNNNNNSNNSSNDNDSNSSSISISIGGSGNDSDNSNSNSNSQNKVLSSPSSSHALSPLVFSGESERFNHDTQESDLSGSFNAV